SEEAALGRGLWSGAEGDRTPDLRHAMAALSQLSYSPKSGDHGSEVIVLGHLDQSLLVVPGGRQPKVDCRQPGDVPDREVEASLERGAVHSNCVDLVRRVGGSDVSARRVAAGSSLYHDDVAVESTPLALHTKQPPPVEVEHQVVSAALLQWTQDENAELDGHRSNSGLRNRPLSLDFIMRRTLVRPSDGTVRTRTTAAGRTRARRGRRRLRRRRGRGGSCPAVNPWRPARAAP